MKLYILNYIRPKHGFSVMKGCVENFYNLPFLDKWIWHARDELPKEFQWLLKTHNITYEDEVESFWVPEMLRMILDRPDAHYIWLAEEETRVVDLQVLEKGFLKLVDTDRDYFPCAFDTYWQPEAQYLLNSYKRETNASEDEDFWYLDWGTYPTSFLRKSHDRKISVGYPVSVGGIFKRELLIKLLNMVLDCNYENDGISKGMNKFAPHSFEHCQAFWDLNRGITYKILVSKKIFGIDM